MMHHLGLRKTRSSDGSLVELSAYRAYTSERITATKTADGPILGASLVEYLR